MNSEETSLGNTPDMFGEESSVLDISTPPDIVQDAGSKFATSPNRHDTLKRPRLPAAMYSMELEWREHPVSMIHRQILTESKLGILLFVTFCLSTFVLAPLVRLYGGGLLSAVTYPVVFFLFGLAAFFRFITTNSLASAGRWFVFPQLGALFLEWAFSPAVNPWWTAAPTCLAIASVGWLADRVNTHYIRWITANLNLKQETVLRRRAIWDLRFNWIALSREISVVGREIHGCESRGDVEQAFIARRRADELRELRQYLLGFSILMYIAVLLFAGAPVTVVILSGFAASVVLAYRRPPMKTKLHRLIVEVIVLSFVSWFSWDPKQEWVHSPGMFHDRLSSRYRRLTQTGFCFLLIDIAFVPPVQLWGLDEMMTPVWLWTFAYHFFANLMLPAFLSLCTLVATGARPLWMHLAAIEWAEESEEFE